MKIKEKLLILLRAIAFVCVLMVVFNAVKEVMYEKKARERVTFAYTRQPGQVDVVFSGTSHVNCAIYPYELYNRYGITSVNQAQDAQTIPLSYYSIQEMIEMHHPKLIVLDLYYLYQKNPYPGMAYAHYTLDNMRSQRLRIQAIMNVDVIPPQSRAEMLLPFIVYHSRWNELEKDDFLPTNHWMGGASIVNEGYIGDDPVFELLDSSDQKQPPQIQLRYLEKIVQLCRESDTQLLFTVVPYRAWGFEQSRDLSDDQRYYNWMENWCKERNVPLINMLYLMDDMNIDLKADMREWNHLNVYGGIKTTAYLGEYIQNRYNLPDHRQDSAYANWQVQADEYTKKIEQLIGE